jgi:signal transduction histidine kinase
VVTPDNLTENAKPPPVLITRVAVNDQSVARFSGVVPTGGLIDLRNAPAALQLAPDHRRLEFDFTALSFSAPENVRFRYRLEGFDDEWVDGGRQRSVTYSRLARGDYRFSVKACNGDGVWNETGTTLALRVLPFFWQTWWFQTTAVGLVVSSIIGGVRYASFRRLRRRVQELEQRAALDRERSRIARDIHDDLGSRLTQATLLVELAQRAAPEKSAEHMQHIAATVRQVSESLDEIIWAVNPRNDVFPRLINYVTQFAVDFLNTADIRCRVDVPNALPEHPISPEVRHHLLLVAKEALTNVARHSRANEAWVRVAVRPEGFTLGIEDNGGGCSGTPDDVRADGLRNMQQRMRDIGGDMQLESQPNMGTRLSFSLAWTHCAPAVPKPGPEPNARTS